jgi:hypothetical protein
VQGVPVSQVPVGFFNLTFLRAFRMRVELTLASSTSKASSFSIRKAIFIGTRLQVFKAALPVFSEAVVVSHHQAVGFHLFNKDLLHEFSIGQFRKTFGKWKNYQMIDSRPGKQFLFFFKGSKQSEV